MATATRSALTVLLTATSLTDSGDCDRNLCGGIGDPLMDLFENRFHNVKTFFGFRLNVTTFILIRISMTSQTGSPTTLV
jgi:hypothetical protein